METMKLRLPGVVVLDFADLVGVVDLVDVVGLVRPCYLSRFDSEVEGRKETIPYGIFGY
jgi:hypothetical protein